MTGAGATGAAVVGHPDVDKVAFTGSTAVGRAIAKATAGTDKKLDARTRRQGREHRVRGRADRPGHRGHRQRDLLQPGPRLLRGQPAAGAGVDPRRRRRAAEDPPVDAADGRPARQEHRHRSDQLARAAGPHPRAQPHRRGGGRRALDRRLRHPRQRLLVRADDLHERAGERTASPATRSSGRCSRC